MQVVELIKQYKSTFDDFEVWSESQNEVDPVLIGKVKKKKKKSSTLYGDGVKH